MSTDAVVTAYTAAVSDGDFERLGDLVHIAELRNRAGASR